MVRRAKVAALTTLMAGGVLLGSVCSMSDIRHNFQAGTYAFVKDFSTGLWDALFPEPEDLVGTGE
ncbi:MAG: hypothetical protein KJ749_04830 [Planctomycetes bacterium]|nr:hypothetical protein [Planctomycetota bacterium]